MEWYYVFIFIVSIVSCILSVTLFFKVWGMCNDVRDLHRIIAVQEFDKEFEEEQIAFYAMLGRKGRLQRLLDEYLVKQYLEVMNNSKEVFDDELDRKIADITKRNKALYKKYDCRFPARFDDVKTQDIRDYFVLGN